MIRLNGHGANNMEILTTELTTTLARTIPLLLFVFFIGIYVGAIIPE